MSRKDMYKEGIETRFKKGHKLSKEIYKKRTKTMKLKFRIIKKAKELMSLTIKDFKALQEDIKKHPEKYTMRDIKAIQYIMNNTWLLDYIDRTEGKAVSKLEISGKGGKPMTFQNIDDKMPADEAMKIYLETLKQVEKNINDKSRNNKNS